MAWLGIGRLVGMVGHGGRLGRLPEGKSEHCVERERTVHAKNEYSVDTQIAKCHVCAYRMRCHFQKQAFCAYTPLAGLPSGPKE